jgi:hypothetical protein
MQFLVTCRESAWVAVDLEMTGLCVQCVSKCLQCAVSAMPDTNRGHTAPPKVAKWSAKSCSPCSALQYLCLLCLSQHQWLRVYPIHLLRVRVTGWLLA